MPIEGPLRELSIHDVFQLLDLARKTGVLRVTSELRQNGGTVWFEDGAVVAAEIRSNPHPLGAVLLHAGKITEADLARARDLQAAGDPRRLGEILVATGALGRRELERQVRAQVEEVIFELMGWSEGYFSFSEAALDDVPAQASVRIPTEALLMEAARRIDEWSRIESKVPHLGVVPRLVPPETDQGPPMDLLPGEWQVLAAVDGRRDLRGIAAGVGRSEFEVARTVFGLATAGVLALDDPRAPLVPPAVSGEVSDLLARAEAYLIAGRPEGCLASVEEALLLAGADYAPALVLAGRAHLAAERWTEAGEAFTRALAADPLAPSARRLVGVALAAQGRLEEAAGAWDTWARLGNRPSDEAQREPVVATLKEAAAVLARAVRETRD